MMDFLYIVDCFCKYFILIILTIIQYVNDIKTSGWHPCHGQCQVRSLTGAVHLQNNNEGVQRSAQCGQKPHVEHKGKCWLDLDVQYILRQLKLGLTILLVVKSF